MRKFMISEEKKKKSSRRKPCRNFHNAKRKLHWNVYAALAESFRRYNSSRFTLPFARLSLTILYAWSNSPFSPSNFQNESANSRNQIFRCVTHLTDGLSRSLARTPFFFFCARSSLVHAIIHFESPPGRENSPYQRRWCEKLAGNYFVGCIFDGSSRLADKSRRGMDMDFRTRINVLRSRGDIAGTS